MLSPTRPSWKKNMLEYGLDGKTGWWSENWLSPLCGCNESNKVRLKASVPQGSVLFQCCATSLINDRKKNSSVGRDL